jgi:tol-pal system protein YbgF
MIKPIFALSLLCALGAAVHAAPAPVADINSGSNEQRITALERMFTTRSRSQHRIQAQLDILQNEVNELRGSVEEHSYQLEKILQRQRELYLEIDKRISAVLAQVSKAAPGEPVQDIAAAPPLSEGENEAYDQAVNLILKDKRYEQAIPAFKTFLQNFPDSTYSPNAHYWLGQLLFNKQDWAGASEQFQSLVNKYPDSTKRADALLKLGVSEFERANVARAQQLWQQVVAQYPDSSAEKLANKRLQDLN